MFGTFRFVLAAFVALSHFGVQRAGFNPGQWAVISFYTLSGLLMERQFQKLSRGGNGKRSFYLDRFLRVYPLYFIVLLIACSVAWPAWREALANFALLPLDYTDFSRVNIIIQPAWSLACEAHFYILVPLLVCLPLNGLRWVLVSSLSLFVISPFLPYSTFWAYGGLPGILFVFVSGILLNRKDFLFLKWIVGVMALLLVLFSLSKVFKLGLPTGIHINVAIGYLIAMPSVFCLDRFSPKVKWDAFLGLFSFPLFLCHGLAADFARSHFALSNPLGLLACAIAFSAVLIAAVEAPFDHIRYKLRAKVAKAAPPPAAPATE